MIIEDVATAVIAVLAGDSTLVSLIGSENNIVFGQVPTQANTGSLIVLNIACVGTNDTDSKDIELLELSFLVRVGRDTPQNALQILDRIRGDAVYQTNNIPTFGLHRFDIPLAGSAASTHRLFGCRRVRWNPVDVDEPDRWFAYEAIYRTHMNTI